MPYVDNTVLNLPDSNLLTSSKSKSNRTPKSISNRTTGSDDTIEYNQLVHDLKSPVNSIKGIVNLANNNLKGKEIQEYLLMINQCVDKLEDKISSTLNMFEQGMLVQNTQQINFEELVGEIMASLKYIPDFDKVDFKININTKKSFYSSRPVLESVLQNLCENAIKYRCTKKEKCSVVLTISDTEDGVQIKFSDNGIGISEDKLPYIFDSHFKSDLHKSSNGLGLYIVKKAVKKLHGDIKLHSKEGEGTTFFINLPE